MLPQLYLLPAPAEAQGSVSTPMLSDGWYHSLALKTDGTVWSWGANWDGELGDGTTVDKLTPVQVMGLTDVVALSAGSPHSLALKPDGTVWSWGRNSSGQLGDGTTVDKLTPVQSLVNLDDVEAAKVAADEAKAALNEALAGYEEADYTAANWQSLLASKADGDAAIDAAADVAAVEAAKNAALEAMAAVETILDTAKAEAIVAVDALPAVEDLTLADKTYVNAARAKVEAALSLGAVVGDITNMFELLAAENRIAELEGIIIFGDVNNDGIVDIADAILILHHIAGLTDIKDVYGPEAIVRAKLSVTEGELDVGDVILILRYIVGVIDVFPIEAQ